MIKDINSSAEGSTWVDQNTSVSSTREFVVQTVKDIMARRSDLYFFEGLADYNERKHIIILLALDRNSALAGYAMHDVYAYIIHTGELSEGKLKANIESVVLTPGDTYSSTHTKGLGATDYPVELTNYNGNSVEVRLKNFTASPGTEMGLVPAFDDGINQGAAGNLGEWAGFPEALTYSTNEYTAYAKQTSIGTWQVPIPQLTTLAIHYVDQKTGEKIAADKTFSGFTYQGYTISGLTAPEIDGYTYSQSLVLNADPNASTTEAGMRATTYSDGTLSGQFSQYKVGETYPLYYSDNVVVEQTVLNAAGDVRARAYFNGLPIPGATAILKNGSTDTMTFIYDGVTHVYQNKIGTVQQELTFFYKPDEKNESTIRVHYIDVTSSDVRKGFLPEDGKEMLVESRTGTIGDDYAFTIPTEYADYAVLQSDDNAFSGQYGIEDHDVYIYLSNRMDDRFTPTAGTLTVTTGHVMNASDAQKLISNADELPAGTTYAWATTPDTTTTGDHAGVVKVAYSDGTSELVDVTVTVEGKKFPTLPDVMLVDDAQNLTDEEKATLVKNLDKVNDSYWVISSDGFKDTDDGWVLTVRYNDWGDDNDYDVDIPGVLLVRQRMDADKYEPTVPSTKTKVKNTVNVQDDEKTTIIQAIKDANADNTDWLNALAEDGISIADDGTATITYADGSTDQIAGTDLVVSWQSGHHMPIVPRRTLVADVNNVTDEEKALALKAVQDANPTGTNEVATVVWNDAKDAVLVAYEDGTTNSIPLSELVQAAMEFPADLMPVYKLDELTPDEKTQLKQRIIEANKGYFPVDYSNEALLVEVEPQNDGSVVLTYSQMDENGNVFQRQAPITIASDRLVTLAQASQYPAVASATKLAVVDPNNLNETELAALKEAVIAASKAANPDFPVTADQIEIVQDTDSTNGTGWKLKVSYADGSDSISRETASANYSTGVEAALTRDDLVSAYVVTTNADLTVTHNKTLAADKAVTIKDADGNSRTLPAGSITWATAPDTSAVSDSVPATVQVTFPGNVVKTYDVNVKVTNNLADDTDVTLPTAKVSYDASKGLSGLTAAQISQIKNNLLASNTFPEGTTGAIDGDNLVINYSDGSQDTVALSALTAGYTVTAKEAQTVLHGNTLTADQLVTISGADANADPSAVTVAWAEEPNWDQLGTAQTASVAVTLPGEPATTITVPVTVTVEANQADQFKAPTAGSRIGYNLDSATGLADVQDQVKQMVQTANNGTTVLDGATWRFDDQGNLTLNFSDGSATTLTADQLVVGYHVTPATDVKVARDGSKDAASFVTITDANGQDAKQNVTVKWQDQQPDWANAEAGSTLNGTVTVTLPNNSQPLTVDVSMEVTEALVDTVDAPLKVGYDSADGITAAVKTKLQEAFVAKNSSLGLTTDDVVVADDGTVTVTLNDKSRTFSADQVLQAYTVTVAGGDLVTGNDVPTAASAVTSVVAADGTTVAQPQVQWADDWTGTLTATGEQTHALEITLPNGVTTTKQVTYTVNQNQTADLAGLTDKVGYVGTIDSQVKAAVEAALKAQNPSLASDSNYHFTFDDDGNLTISYEGQKATKTFTADELYTAYTVSVAENPSLVRGNDIPAASDFVTVIPADGTATVEWKATPQELTAGELTGTAKITLPGGVTVEKDVTIALKDNQASQVQGLNAGERIGYDGAQDTDAGIPAAVQTMVKEALMAKNPSLTADQITINSDGSVEISFAGEKVTKTFAANEVLNRYTVTPATGQTLVHGATDSLLTYKYVTITDDQGQKVTPTSVQWTTEPDRSKADVTTTGEMQITFANGLTTTTTVDFTVKANMADQNEPATPATTLVEKPKSLTKKERETVEAAVKNANTSLPIASVETGVDGTTTVTYTDGSKDQLTGDGLVKQSQAGLYTPKALEKTVPVVDPTKLTDGEKAKVQQAVEDANQDYFPEGTKVSVADDGTATVTYPDTSTDTILSDELVHKSQAEQFDPKAPATKTLVEDPEKLTDTEKDAVKQAIVDANAVTGDAQVTLPSDAQITIADDGTATITYADDTTDTIARTELVEQSQAGKTDAKAPTTKVPVTDTKKLTDDEKAKVAQAVKDANQNIFPDGTEVDVADNGTATITYPDKSEDTIDGKNLVTAKTTADKTNPSTPKDKTKVDNTGSLTDGEKDAVKKAIEEANKDDDGNSTLPDGTNITIGDDGTATIKYEDGSSDTIKGDQLVTAKTTADKTDVNVPDVKDKVKVDDTKNLTDTEKDQVKEAVEKANQNENGKSTLPEGTEITIGDDGTATIAYPDGSKDTIKGNDLVTAKTTADKTNPSTPEDKTKVDNTSSLTDGEKAAVKKAVEEANKDAEGNSTLPDGTDITIGDDGTATITYKDGSSDTIKGDQLVTAKTTADKTDVKTPADDKKVKVNDDQSLSDTEKDAVKEAIEDVNKDADGNSTLPDGTEITIGDDGTATIKYKDGSKDTIDGTDLVTEKTTADKTDVKTPSADDKVKVDDTKNLTDTEKTEVKDAIKDANKDDNGNSTLPDGTEITIGDDGTATIKYKDGSKDTIDGDQLVTEKTTADNTTPTTPEDKTKVDDPTSLTDDEKTKVKKAIEDANKDADGNSTLPEGTEITIGDDGTATITYEDGSKDTINGDQLVEEKSTADKTNVKTPSADDKVKVDDAKNLTDTEKEAVKDVVDKANQDESGKSTLPDGTDITIGNDGTATITYPDGSKDTIDGDQLVTGKTTADKTEVKTPEGDKVKVTDPDHLTDTEKTEVKEAIEDANKDNDGNSTLPAGTEITIGDDGTATIKYADDSEDTIKGTDLVEQSQAGKTDVKTPSADDKVKVDDTKNLTDTEKEAVKEAIEDANKDADGNSTLPAGTEITIGDDGTATITYEDGSKDTIPGTDLVEASIASQTTVQALSQTILVHSTTSLSDDEKTQVATALKEANGFGDDTDVTVNADGSALITYSDNSTAQVAAASLVEQRELTIELAGTDKVWDGQSADVRVQVVDQRGNDLSDKPAWDDQDFSFDQPSTKRLFMFLMAFGKRVPQAPVNAGDYDVTLSDHGLSKLQDLGKVVKVTDGHFKITSLADNVNPDGPSDKTKVTNPDQLTDTEKDQIKDAIDHANDGQNGRPKLPDGTTIDVDDQGNATIHYPDGSTDPIDRGQLVDPKTDSELTNPSVPTKKTEVSDPTSLTDTEKAEVKDAITAANTDANGKSTLPDGTTISVADDGTAAITYPDKTTNTIAGDDLVTKHTATDAEKYNPQTPGEDDKVKVDDPTSLTDEEKTEVKDAVEDANKDTDGKSTLPDDTTIDVADDGTTTIAYPDGSKDQIAGDDLVEKKSDADKADPKTPSGDDKVKVDDPKNLTDDEKDQVKDAITDANKDESGKSTLPDNTTVDVDDQGNATITYPDGSKDTIDGDDLVEKKSDADKTDLKTPEDKTKVDDPSHLTDGEKQEVEDKVKDENPGTTVDVDDQGNATVTYPDGSKHTIDGDDLVEKKSDADKSDPEVPTDKTKVDDPSHLTDGEKQEVEDKVKDENPGTTVDVDDQGNATVTYPDGSKDTIKGDDLVEKKSDADKTDPKTSADGDKVKVDDPKSLTDDEKDQVKDEITDANKDADGKSTLPDGTTVDVDNEGNATITYPDGSKDMIDHDDLIEPKTDADKNDPKTPEDKTKVDDPSHLTDGEKQEVEDKVKDANPGTTVDVDDQGNATVTYPDGSKDTIKGDDLVEKKSDADKTDPKTPEDKTKVDDPSHLTDSEKQEVEDKVKDANPGTTVDVDDQGNATVTYPDGSKDTIDGDDLVEKKSDADKSDPKTPSDGDKVKVDDPKNLTDDEKDQVKDEITDANKDESGKSTLPDGTTVDVDDEGNATVTYPDGSKDTIDHDDLVEPKTDGEKTDPKTPSDGDKVKVDDPTSLTDDEKDQVKDEITDANKDESGKSTLPDGTTVDVDNEGNATITYPDGSKDTIGHDDLVEPKTTAEQTDVTTPSERVLVHNAQDLTTDEKAAVADAIKAGNDLPAGATVTVNDDGSAVVTYADGSKDQIAADQLIEQIQVDVKFAAQSKLWDGQPATVKVIITDQRGNDLSDQIQWTAGDFAYNSVLANPQLMALMATSLQVADAPTTAGNYEVTLSAQGQAKVAELVGQIHQITPGRFAIESYSQTTDPTVPADKTKVDDASHLTPSEKTAVEDKVAEANPDTTVDVDDQGNATVTYRDGSHDTIGHDELIDPKTDAEKTTPNVPSDKTKVDDASHLTDTEKDAVKDQVAEANPGTTVDVADDGTATITYPDGSKNTIDGDKLIDQKTDAEKTDPVLPADKAEVAEPTNLTKDERDDIAGKVAELNPGTMVEVDEKGNATITYPDGSQDQVKAGDLIELSMSKPTASDDAPEPADPTTDPEPEPKQDETPTTDPADPKAPTTTPKVTPTAKTAKGTVAPTQATTTTTNQAQSQSAKAAQLPQTGDESGKVLVLTGLALALTGLVAVKKRKQHN